MKKIILSAAVLCTLAFGFRGGCSFGKGFIGDNPLSALVTGILYNGGDGFIDRYYIAAGAEGKIYRSIDPLTDPWIEKNSGTTNSINCLKNLARTDTSVTFGVGDNGTIVRSLDQGMTWTLLNSSVTENLRAIEFIGFVPGNLLAVGEAGRIIRSSNGGDNWSIINSGVAKNLNSVYSLNSFVTIIVGDNGTLLRTSDGGLNWENRSLADSVSDLNKIGLMGTWFFGNILGIVGDNGRLYRSTNFLSWDSIYTGTNADLHELNFKNASSGYVGGDNGVIRYTIDGGNYWNSDFFLESLNLGDVHSTLILNDTTVAGISGNDIIILHANETLLPVELTSFTSTVEKNNVHLKWSTGNEINNSGFNIERSLFNGNNNNPEDWSELGFIEGHGTTSEQNNYKFTDKNLSTGKYLYRLKQIDYNGNFEFFNLTGEVNIGSPQKYSLLQNYPNPFNPVTKIVFELPIESNIKLAVYDITGKEIEVLVDQKLQAGFHQYNWNAGSYSSGTYFYRISSTGESKFSEVKKMLLVK